MRDLAGTIAAAVLLPLLEFGLPLAILTLATAALTTLPIADAACLWYVLGTLTLALGD